MMSWWVLLTFLALQIKILMRKFVLAFSEIGKLSLSKRLFSIFAMKCACLFISRFRAVTIPSTPTTSFSCFVPTKMSHHHHEKDMCVAYLLWFFLGVFGVHRFYLGMQARLLVEVL
jgi:hypothetical protein